MSLFREAFEAMSRIGKVAYLLNCAIAFGVFVGFFFQPWLLFVLTGQAVLTVAVSLFLWSRA